MKILVIVLMLASLHITAFADEGSDIYLSSEQKFVKSKCPKGVQPFYEILRVSPFDNKGMCFGEHPMMNIQLLSRSKALFAVAGARQPFALIEFGKKSAPAQFYSGTVKGLGAFQYTSVSGGLVTVHKFEAISN